MKKKLFRIHVFLLSFILFGFIYKTNAQSPGGVSTSLAFWAKADNAGVAPGATMTSWADRSPNAATLTKNGTSTMVLKPGDAKHNFNPWTTGYSNTNYFSGSCTGVASDYGVTGTFTNSPLTVYGVASAKTVTGGFITGTDYPANNAVQPTFGMINSGGTAYPYMYRLTNPINKWATAASNKVTLDKSSIFMYQPPSGGGTGNLIFGLDGSQSVEPGINATSTLAGPYLHIGYEAYLNSTCTGDIEEVIWYKSALTSTEISKVNSYLAIKYGVTLTPAVATNYVNSAGTTVWTGNATYQKNIGAIGRDDNSALNQKQSNSVNTGSQVIIGNGTSLSNTNALNNNTFSANNSFEIWGDNGLARTLSTTISGIAGVTHRFAAIWKVQETGTVSNVTVAWKVGLTNPTLIRSTDAVFDNTDQAVPLSGITTINGVQYNFATINFNDGDYFTFAATRAAPGSVTTSLAFWAKADDAGVSPGNSMTSWKDLSSNSSDLTVTGTFTLQSGDAQHNFNPWTTGYSSANYFSGSCTGVAVGGSTTTSPITVYGVASAKTVSGGCITGIDAPANNGAQPYCGIINNGGTAYPYLFRYSNGINTWASAATNKVTLNKSSIFMYQPPSGGGTGNLTFGLDGSQSVQSSINATSTLEGPYLHIGYEGYINNPCSGDIEEVIWYKSALSSTDISKVNSYLAIKYGITLTPGVATNYVNSAGTVLWSGNATYQNNIGAISRDDNSGLNQKQSRSVSTNSNGQLTIALGKIASDNLANLNEFSKDQTSLVWGDNGTTTSLATASTVFTYNGYSNNERMNRVWKVSNTGANALTQLVTIQFPTASVGTKTLVGESTCAKYAIIYSTDQTFASGVTSSILVTNGTNYEVSKKFPSGVTYFTFAKVNETPAGSVYLPVASANITVSDACLKATGWKYYYFDAAKTQRAFGINWNGNTEPGTLNGVLSYSESPLVQYSAGNVYQANIMGRLLEILPAGGNYTANGGVKVKIFFDSLELTNSLAPNAVSQKWFKFSGDSAATIAANNGQSIIGATFLTPAASGEEDGFDYVQFDGIQSFSTFGFASNTGQGALPIKLESFTATGKGCNAILNWKTASEFNMQKFVIEQSLDGYVFTEVATIPVANSSNGKTYQNVLAQSNQQVYYRLRIVDNNGQTSYSSTQLVKSNCADGNSLNVFPNPIGAATNLNLILSTTFRGNLKIDVVNTAGQNMISKNVIISSSNNSIPLNIEKLNSGIYLIKFTGVKGEEVFKAQKIIK